MQSFLFPGFGKVSVYKTVVTLKFSSDYRCIVIQLSVFGVLLIAILYSLSILMTSLYFVFAYYQGFWGMFAREWCVFVFFYCIYYYLYEVYLLYHVQCRCSILCLSSVLFSFAFWLYSFRFSGILCCRLIFQVVFSKLVIVVVFSRSFCHQFNNAFAH